MFGDIPPIPRVPFPVPLLVLYIAYDKGVFFHVIPVCIITPRYVQDYDVHSLHYYCATLTQAKLSFYFTMSNELVGKEAATRGVL